MVSYADLKKYVFYSIFGFPALPFPGDKQPEAAPPSSLDASKLFTPTQVR
jgi:hypothetical protein